ncbi:hypothetical protein ACWEQN_44705 [Streptomyces sp. NPDC004129]
MNRIPALWAAAYGSQTPRLRRYLARRAVRLAAFVKALALADHRPFTSLCPTDTFARLARDHAHPYLGTVISRLMGPAPVAAQEEPAP